jgi:hypothetical protein
MELLYLIFGPLLLLVVLICADARGGPLLQGIGDRSQGGLRYVAIAGFVLTVVGLMVTLPKKG